MFRAVTTQIAISQIIGKDEYHIWLGVGESDGRSSDEQEPGDEDRRAVHEQKPDKPALRLFGLLRQ